MAERYETVEAIGDETVLYFVGAAVMAALMGVFAQAQLPTGPVPITLQTLGVFLVLLVLGPLWGSLSMGLYVLVGLAGVPVFAGWSAGLGVVLGPSGGFLIGFPIAAAVGGALIHRSREPRSLRQVAVPIQVGGLLVALAIIYAIGIPWMAVQQGLTLNEALVQLVAFVPGDVVALVASLVLVTGGYLADSQLLE